MRRVITVFSLCLLFMISCKENEDDNSTDFSDAEAGYAILKINEVVDYLSITRRVIEDRKKDIDKLEKITYRQEIDSLEGIPNFDDFVFKEARRYLISDLEYLQEEAMFTYDEKTLFKEKLPIYDRNFKKLLEASISYIHYLDNKKYEVDQWEGAKDYCREINEARDICYNINQTLFNTIESMAERIEPIAFADSQSGRMFMSAKVDFKLFKKLSTEIRTYNDTKRNSSEIEKLFKELELNIETNKNDFNSEVSRMRIIDEYQAYYGVLTNGLSEMKKMFLAINEGKRLSEVDLEELNVFNHKASDGFNALSK